MEENKINWANEFVKRLLSDVSKYTWTREYYDGFRSNVIVRHKIRNKKCDENKTRINLSVSNGKYILSYIGKEISSKDYPLIKDIYEQVNTIIHDKEMEEYRKKQEAENLEWKSRYDEIWGDDK